MTKDQLEAAIKICETQVEAMTNECLRRNQYLKMREYSHRIHGCIVAMNYYKEKIKELDVENQPVKRGPGRPRKEVTHV